MMAGSYLDELYNSSKQAVIWNVEDGAILSTLSNGYDTTAAALWNPAGTRLLLHSSNKTLVVTNELKVIMSVPSIGTGSWGPDGLAFVILRTTSCEVWNSSSEELISSWDCDAPKFAAWSPAPRIAVSFDRFANVYDVNGSYFSTCFVNASISFLLWTPSSNLITGGESTRMWTEDGSTIVQDVYGAYASGAINANGAILVTCDQAGCSIWDGAVLQQLMVLPQGAGGIVAGLSSDGTILLAYGQGGSLLWNVQISLSASIFLPSDAVLGFPDSGDWFYFIPLTHKMLNIRTMTYHATSCPSIGAEEFCQGGGVITVFVDGRPQRTFSITTQNPLAAAGTNVIMTYQDDMISMYTPQGIHLRDIIPPFPLNVRSMQVFNDQLFAFTNTSSRYHGGYLWNAITGEFRDLGFHGYTIRWSWDGQSLAMIAILPPMLVIFDSFGNVTLQIPLSGQISEPPLIGWSADNSLISLSSNGLCGIVSLKLKTQYLLTTAVPLVTPWCVWKDNSMEIVAVDSRAMRSWRPLPEILNLETSSSIVHSLTTINITMVGAGAVLLPPSTPAQVVRLEQAMLRWVDSSTLTTQCLYLDATHVNAYTVVLEPVILPSPGLYTFCLPTTPWLQSDISFVGECPSSAVPVINQTGLTNCGCPNYLYAASDNILQCLTCPAYGVCDGTTHIASKLGYWSIVEEPTNIVSCASGVCQGNNQCALNYHGPLCGFCTEGAGQHGFRQCRVCSSLWSDALLFLIAFICWVAVSSIQALFALGWRSSPQSNNNSAQLALILLSTTQTTFLLLNVNVDLKSLTRSLGFPEAAQGGGVQSPAFSCLAISAGLSPDGVHFLKLCILLLITPLAWLFLFLARIVLLRRGVNTSMDIVRVSTVVVWTSLQTSISTALFQTLACTEVDSEGFGSRLSHDFFVPCYDTRYWVFIGLVSIPAMTITMFVIPFGIVRLLRSYPSALESGYLRFLIKNYRADWWFLVVFYRKLILVALVTFTRNPFYVACALLAASLLHLWVSPSTSNEVNIAEGISLVSLAFVFCAVGAFGLNDTFSTYAGGPGIIATTLVLCYLFQIGLLLYDRWHWRMLDQQSEGLESVIFQRISKAKARFTEGGGRVNFENRSATPSSVAMGNLTNKQNRSLKGDGISTTSGKAALRKPDSPKTIVVANDIESSEATGKSPSANTVTFASDDLPTNRRSSSPE